MGAPLPYALVWDILKRMALNLSLTMAWHIRLVADSTKVQATRLLMAQSQCRGSLGDQFYFHDVVENIESGINPPKKPYKESAVVTS